jgi:hypothetical protein
MTKIVQEKFQVNYPDRDSSAENQTSWVTDAEARVKKHQPGREGRAGGDSASRFVNNATFFNSLPPGMDIEDQEVTDQRRMGISFNGNHPVGGATVDRTQELTADVLRTGFSRKKLLATDDEYTREHNDAFYDVVEVDGVEGFVERNNMLDRL